MKISGFDISSRFVARKRSLVLSQVWLVGRFWEGGSAGHGFRLGLGFGISR